VQIAADGEQVLFDLASGTGNGGLRDVVSNAKHL